MTEVYKFQKLEVYRLALVYARSVYTLIRALPENERYNLVTQINRAATSIVLNIAEGSTGQSNAEQSRFLTMAIRSYIETIACFDLIEQFGYADTAGTQDLREQGHRLFVKLSAFRKALKK